MNIAVAGVGYVGLSLAARLAGNHQVNAYDISEERMFYCRRDGEQIVLIGKAALFSRAEIHI